MRVIYNEEANRAYLTPVRGDDFRPARTDPEFIRFIPPTVPSPSVSREKQFNDGIPWFELNVTGGGKSSVGRHLLVKAINEASQGRMPLVYGPPVYVQPNGIQTPEQLGKSKNPEVQVAAVEATYMAVEQYGTPTAKLQAFQALAELLRALHGLLEYTPTQRIKFCHDEPMMFLVRRALNTIPLSPPAVLLKTLESRRELEQATPRLNFLIGHLCHKIIPEAGMKVLFRNELEKYEQKLGQSAHSYGDELGARANMVEFADEAHRERELTRLFKYGLLPALRERVEQFELLHPEGTLFDFHSYRRMLSATGKSGTYSENRRADNTVPRESRSGAGGGSSWKSSFQKMAVPVMAVRVSDPGAVDDQEEKWAQAVYWNELIDKIDELPDAGTFIQTFSI